jgi:hypothetical protein
MGMQKKPSSGYYRKDPNVFQTIDNLMDQGMTTDQINNRMADKDTRTTSTASVFWEIAFFT